MGHYHKKNNHNISNFLSLITKRNFLGNYLVAIVMDASDPVGIAMNPNDPADIVIYTIESCRFPTAVWRTERKLVTTQGLMLFALCNCGGLFFIVSSLKRL